MIIITGGAGFIGSNLIHFLNKKKNHNIVIFDSLNKLKKKNLEKLNFKKLYFKSEIFNFLKVNKKKLIVFFILVLVLILWKMIGIISTKIIMSFQKK